jgi:serine/threonine protein kinase
LQGLKKSIAVREKPLIKEKFGSNSTILTDCSDISSASSSAAIEEELDDFLNDDSGRDIHINSLEDLDFPSDMILPKGSLHIYSYKMNMGPIGIIKTGSFRCKHKVAVKSCVDMNNRTTSMKKQATEKELYLLKYLGSHPTILPCYGYVMNGISLSIVYELAPYGSLDNILTETKISSFPLSLIVAWLSDLADAMQFLHSKGVIHGDIRAENILVFDRLETKLCNFTKAKSVVSSDEDPGFSPEPFKELYFIGEKDQKQMTSYTIDITGFFNTALQILTRKSLSELQYDIANVSKDKRVAETMISFPVSEYNESSSLYFLLLSIHDSEKKGHVVTSKEISDQLAQLLEDACDGDPRECENPYNNPFKGIELICMSKVDNLSHLISLSSKSNEGTEGEEEDVSQQIALQMILNKIRNGKGNGNGSNNSSPLSSPKPQTEVILDYRKTMTEWFTSECLLNPVVSHEIASLCVQNHIFNPITLKQKVSNNPSILKLLKVGDKTVIASIQTGLSRLAMKERDMISA